MSFRLLVTLCCITLVLNTMAFMTIAPVLPELFAEWSLSGIEAGLLGGAFFVGYVAAVPVLVTLTDRILPKRIYIASGIIGTVSCFGFAVLADGMWSGFAFRALTGVGVAGTYMPALKALVDSLEEPRRSRAAFYYSSVYAIGTALSILVAGEVSDWLDWRWAFAVAGFGTLGGLVLGWAVLPDGRVSPRTRSQFGDFRRVFANRAAMVNIVSYFGHLWEVFSNRVWIVTFLVFAESTRDGGFIISVTLLATLVALIGVPASMAAGEVAARHGREIVIRAAMVVSCATGIALVLATGGPLWLVGVLVLAYGMTGYADTGTINAATVSVAEPEVLGATMAVHAAVGFAGGILGSLAVGVALQAAGGRDSASAWTAAFLVMAAGTAFGYLVRWVADRMPGAPGAA